MENLDNINEIKDMNYELESSDTSFISELIKIKRSSQSPEMKLNILDILVRDFLNKKFHVKKNNEYSELVESFLQKNNPDMAVFCHQMIKYLYGGESLNKNTLDQLIDEAREVMEKELGLNNKKETKKGLFSNLFKANKKEDKTQNSINVNKQTEKIINKSLMPEGLIRVENLKNDNPGRDIEKFEEELDNNSELKDKNLELIKNNIDSSSSESIRSIDDLERIKEKIRYRKLEIAKEKSEQISSDKFDNQI